MKHSAINYLSITLAALGLTVFTASAEAPLDGLNLVTVALTLQSQGGFSGDGTVSTYAKPTVSKMDTKDILNQLARDKYAQSVYSATSFPNGSKLALAGGFFVVVDKNDQLIVDVSDIMRFSAGDNDILSGKINDTTRLASPSLTELIVVKLTFDDTFIFGGGNLKFFAQGLDTVQTKDSKPNASGNYSENSSDSVKNSAGEGSSKGSPFVLTGSIQGKRNVKLTLK